MDIINTFVSEFDPVFRSVSRIICEDYYNFCWILLPSHNRYVKATIRLRDLRISHWRRTTPSVTVGLIIKREINTCFSLPTTHTSFLDHTSNKRNCFVHMNLPKRFIMLWSLQAITAPNCSYPRILRTPIIHDKVPLPILITFNALTASPVEKCVC
jgi:hypothetical protein